MRRPTISAGWGQAKDWLSGRCTGVALGLALDIRSSVHLRVCFCPGPLIRTEHCMERAMPSLEDFLDMPTHVST
jgi:hypothetical protein